MSESIRWHELTPAQRDVLVHEKVMGITELHCTGKLSYDGENTMYGHYFFICEECRARLTVTAYYREGCGVPKGHVKHIPDYCRLSQFSSFLRRITFS